ncbi:MAG: hypothetical protein J5685_10760 [Clostridiales bacterium]|nr:hypothetical protein [Clostridiales bacterium]
MRPEKSEMTDILIMPEELSYGDNNGKTVLFKHDYYSSDSDYGRTLLGSLINALSEDHEMIRNVIFVDSSVKLFDSPDPSFERMIDLLKEQDTVIYVSDSSLKEYNVALTGQLKINLLSDTETAELLLCLKADMIIE